MRKQNNLFSLWALNFIYFCNKITVIKWLPVETDKQNKFVNIFRLIVVVLVAAAVVLFLPLILSPSAFLILL